MFATRFFTTSYRYVLKPVLFLFDPEAVHEGFTTIGAVLEGAPWLVSSLFQYKNPSLHRRVLGVEFENPIGLGAGFDYDGYMTSTMHAVGFGFSTVGTVTARPYAGNSGPHLARLPRSQSLLVNKGFKSSGARTVRARLDKKHLADYTVGVSVGSSNVAEVNTVQKAVGDYLETFKIFAKRKYVKYFELNVSCPNTAMPSPFTEPENFKKLVTAVEKLHLKQPIFVKMPNELSLAESDKLVEIALADGIRGFIFANLVKDRDNAAFDKQEMTRLADLKGNFSGRPTFANSNRLIAHARKKFGKKIAIIGLGGVFTVEDAEAKFRAGADLVQLVTGLIFEGPQLPGAINRELAR